MACLRPALVIDAVGTGCRNVHCIQRLVIVAGVLDDSLIILLLVVVVAVHHVGVLLWLSRHGGSVAVEVVALEQSGATRPLSRLRERMQVVAF